MTDVRGKRVLVVGLARSGFAAARCLARRGAVVTVTDLRPPQVFSQKVPELLELKVGVELGLHRAETFLCQDMIVVSPGVPADLAALNPARQKGIPVVPEIEVAGWFLEGRLTGITGTNGKTTTTALVGKILEASGFSTFVGGNIGVPLLQALDQVPPPQMVVSELSSFQLEVIHSFRPQVAVLLNLTPNHLDRHPDFDAYARAKARIFENQTQDDYAILNADDNKVMSLAAGIGSRKIYFSRQRELAGGVFISGGKIRYRVGNLEADLMTTEDVRLRGEFNLENVLAATAAACVLGVEFGSIRRGVREFYGVEHRLEFVGELQDVAFYNDSKATSVDAAEKALSTFEHGVHLILGGKDKGAPYRPLRDLIQDRVREVLVIGAARERIKRELAGAADIFEAVELETAVRKAFERAEPGDVILLAPACASFDQFENFEHRGRVFKEVVERLAEENAGKPGIRSHRAEKRSEGQESEAAAPNSPLPALEGPQLSSSEPQEPALRENAGEARAVDASVGRATFRLAAPRELEYVYEISAEENSPGAGLDLEDGGVEEAFIPGGQGRLEDAKDEILAYEVRSSLAGQSKEPINKRDGRVRTSPKKRTK